VCGNIRVQPNAISLLFVGLLTASSAAHGQVEGRQSYRVRVGPRVSVTAPPAEVTTAYKDNDPDASFAAQRWTVDTNSRSGATVSFSTTQAFTHTTKPQFKRDVAIQLEIPRTGTAAEWKVVIGKDRTCHAAGATGETATVRATSRRPGQGIFDVTVTFLAEPKEKLESGDYALTLVGTVTAN
jgi:hypothetical protein